MEKRITKSNLQAIYMNNTNVKAARMLNIAPQTLLRYVKRAGIPLKGFGRRGYKIQIIDK
jgi:hypothetical protein